jgi:hypothetical protein
MPLTAQTKRLSLISQHSAVRLEPFSALINLGLARALIITTIVWAWSCRAPCASA